MEVESGSLCGISFLSQTVAASILHFLLSQLYFLRPEERMKIPPSLQQFPSHFPASALTSLPYRTRQLLMLTPIHLEINASGLLMSLLLWASRNKAKLGVEIPFRSLR